MEVSAPVNIQVSTPTTTTTIAAVHDEVTTPTPDAKSSETLVEKVVPGAMMTAPSADVVKARTKAPVPTEKEDDKMSLADSVDQSNETDEEEDEVPPEEEEEDEEFKLAMELAIAAAQNPHLSPAEIQQLVGDKNKQKAMVDEIAKQKEMEEAEQRKKEAANGWWATAAKKAEQMKDRAERRLYAETIRKDREVIEKRKAIRVLRKTLKAHRLQGNRVETRHAFKRQRMEKKLFLVVEKLQKTQKLFTQGNYNVQEYLKAMMRSSKKWRKKGTDEELMLEAQLCRNMHQMLALEKQKVKCKKNTKEMKKYLQRCKGWLSDKEAFCEMNLMTLEATQSSIVFLLEETLSRQDDLIEKLKASEEFKNVDLEDVDLSHVKLPSFSLMTSAPKADPMRGLPITDSIKVKRDHEGKMTLEEREAQIRAFEQAQSRNELVKKYYSAHAHAKGGAPEIYVETKDDISVSSRLSDPDASDNGEQEDVVGNDSESVIKFGKDVPWNAGVSLDSEDKEELRQDEAAARQMIQQMEAAATTPIKTDEVELGSDTESPTASTGKSALKEAISTERAKETTVN